MLFSTTVSKSLESRSTSRNDEMISSAGKISKAIGRGCPKKPPDGLTRDHDRAKRVTHLMRRYINKILLLSLCLNRILHLAFLNAFSPFDGRDIGNGANK